MSDKVAVLVGFLLFLAVLAWFKVPGMVASLLDKRADGIKAQLDEARQAREDAQKMLSSLERKTADAERDAQAIVDRAQTDAKRAAEQAQHDLKESIARKLKAAEERIAQVEAAATREVRNAAASAAVAAASDVLGSNLDGEKADAMIDDGIGKISSQFH